MKKQNELNLFKVSKKNPRILKLKQLIKKTLGEIFISQDFRDDQGNSLLIFIDDVVLSKDARIATIFMTNFSKKDLKEEEVLKVINDNLFRIN